MVRRAFGTPQMSLTTHLTLMSTQDDQQRNRRSTSDAPNAVSGAGKSAGKTPTDSHSWQRGFANVWMLVGAAPAGLAIGYFIDRASGTTPWWMLGLSLLFLAVSLYQLVKDSWK
jgi:F0F1-type ATP synthase assembly protein I